MRSTSKSFWSAPGRKPLERVGTGVTRDRFIDADVHLSADVYVFLLQKQAEHPGKEIAGFGVLNDSALMVWASVVAVGQPSSVSITALDAAWSEEEAFRETGQSSNVQIHSHPGMGCFWSSTDTDDQWKRIDGIRDYSPKGEYYFIVFDATKDEFLARKVEWDGNAVRFNDGTVFCGGRDIGRKSYSLSPLTETKASTQAATSYGYYNTQSHATKQDPKKKEASGGASYAGALTDKLEAYLFSGEARPPFDMSNNWAVYQAMLDISVKRSVSVAKIARDIIEKEKAAGTYVALSAGFTYPSYAVNCKIDSMGTMPISSFLEAFLRVHDTPVTAQTPNDILLSQAFSVTKNISYAWCAWDMIDAKSAISSLAVNTRTSFSDEPGKIKRDDFAFWARVHDHSILNAAQRSTFHELKSAKITSAEAKSTKMLLVGYLADILNSGKTGIERVVKEPTISNFDLAMLRRAIAVNRPTMCQLFDKAVSTNTLDATPELVANKIIEFCVSEAKSPDLIERSKLESVYRLIDTLSVDDSVKMFDILDGKQGSLAISEQWILSLMFTGTSGLVPMPLVISDVLSLAIAPISLEDYEDILIGAMNVGIGYMLLMALSQIDIETSDGFAGEEIDVALGEYSIMKIDDEDVSLYQDRLI